LCHHLDCVNGPGIGLEDLQRVHRILIFTAKHGYFFLRTNDLLS
jgi:hypothetical protein